jgi:hypothetical protein
MSDRGIFDLPASPPNSGTASPPFRCRSIFRFGYFSILEIHISLVRELVIDTPAV